MLFPYYDYGGNRIRIWPRSYKFDQRILMFLNVLRKNVSGGFSRWFDRIVAIRVLEVGMNPLAKPLVGIALVLGVALMIGFAGGWAIEQFFSVIQGNIVQALIIGVVTGAVCGPLIVWLAHMER